MTITSNSTEISTAARPPAEPDTEARINKMLTGPSERDRKGRFKRNASASEQPRRTIRGPANAHPDAYGLRIVEPGAGLRLPPGSHVIVEPVLPTKAGLAVFYKKGAGPEIYDLTQNYTPDLFKPVEDGSGLAPMVEVVQVHTGRRGWLNTDAYEKVHRIIAITTPIEVPERYERLPADLPLLDECPDGMGEHLVEDSVLYPLVRPRETVIFDPAKREPRLGATFVFQWSNGHRNVMQTNRRTVGNCVDRWWIDPINRPSREQIMRGVPDGYVPIMHTSDGPFDEKHLRGKIVGEIVGILKIGEHELRRGHRYPIPQTPVALGALKTEA